MVTGGGGFVGRRIIQLLQNDGVECTALGRNCYPDLENQGINCIQGDISDSEFILQKLKGYDVVFHVAALAGIWGSWESYYRINVIGTRNIIKACLGNGVQHLVYTSTPSVVFDRKDIIEGNEELPYPQKFLCNYAKSKAIAEKEILSIHQDDLKTCAIRPHLIWGPHDPHLIPRLIERGKRKQLKIVGDGSNLVDLTYIDNVAHAHILAAKNLTTSATASGNAYFISQERPVVLWEWINDLFEHMNIPRVNKSVSLQTALTAGIILEGVHGVFFRQKEPKMTRFVAEQLARSHCFSHKKAEDDLGYTPIISLEEGMEKLITWLKL